MRRGDRLFEVIEILRRAKGPISAQSIGEELGVTKRTVYRDVAALIGQGVPINGEAGVGYVLEPGFHMPPLMLTPDEIEAVTLGVLWVRSRGEPELALAAEKLITKLESVAPDKYRTSFLQPAVSVTPVDQPDEVLGSAAIRLAIRRRKKITLKYSDNSGQRTSRVIWPIMLGYRDSSRIIAAWCELREGFRYFRTERIVEADVLEESIPRRMDLLRAEWRSATDAERARYEKGN
ncbi:helix-turn-helix transcriptional regulator [Ruegeria atlantica]|uniref:helix-turn-helix transcriptional regulator n=1 Tax=Ruegeria atlantica TaxID=81569 RepID=UPI001481A00F|nr:YafY family protein [Ruegeria atlantica]